MKVFISWSGERSERMAEALKDWLPLILQSITPWMSKSDILPGERWLQAIGKELEACNFGIMCVTPENLTSQWVNFEAGSLAKTMAESRVIPLLLNLDLKELTGPLSQFQAKKADKGGLEEVIRAINASSEVPIPETTIRASFDSFWPQLKERLSSIPAQSATSPKREQPDILEDLVSSVRSLESQVRRLSRQMVSYRADAVARPGDRFDQSSDDAADAVFYPRPEGLVQLTMKEHMVISGFRDKTTIDEIAEGMGITKVEATSLFRRGTRKLGIKSADEMRKYFDEQPREAVDATEET